MPPMGIGEVGTKASVPATDDLPATRSDDAMENKTDLTCVRIKPDEIGEIGFINTSTVSSWLNVCVSWVS